MKSKKKGKVYLVGAGPGDPGLFTLRGATLVQTADVCVVDALAHPVLYASTPAKIIHVGKRGPAAPGGRSVQASQNQISSLLVRLARSGKKVVRLKGGDPIVFARGSEELEALTKARIPFEIVPGVTSVTAVPAYAGIPISDRRLSSKVTLLTGHEGKGAGDHYAAIDWKKLYPNQTLVILMGVTRWAFIRKSLLDSNWPGAKPVCAIENGTMGNQKIIGTTLGASLRDFKKKKLSAPALIIVGDVAKLGSRFSWVKKEKPLLGKTIVVTRPRGQGEGFAADLKEKGATVLSIPAIQLYPASETAALRKTLSSLHSGSYRPDWVVFLSANAVRFFANLYGRKKMPSGVRVCAVGPKTERALNDVGWKAHITPKTYTSRSVARALGSVDGKMILIPRVRHAPEEFPRLLNQKGAFVKTLEVYENKPGPKPSRRLIELAKTQADAITFTSASTVRGFFSFLTKAQARALFQRAKAASIGPITTREIRKAGVSPVWETKTATAEGLVALLTRKLKPK